MTVNELLGALGRFNGLQKVVVEVVSKGRPTGHPHNITLTPIDLEVDSKRRVVIIAPIVTERTAGT